MANHNEVAHAWAHQTGRNRKGFNMFYEGATIYSYGYHFPIAKLCAADGRGVTERDQVAFVLMTSRGYSVSTSKHIGYTRRAIGHLPTVTVKDPSSRPTLEDWQSDLKAAAEAVAKAGRARVYGDAHLRTAQSRLDNANELNRLFDLGCPAVTMETLGVEVAGLQARLKAAQEAREAEARARARIQEAQNRDRLKAWLRCEPGVSAPRTRIPHVRVRGEQVETSWGAAVPLSDALEVYRAALDGHPPQVDRVGAYGPAKVTTRTIRVGCHVIPVRLAKLAAHLAGINLEARA